MSRSLGIAFLVVGFLASGCDNRQAFHEPHPGLERMLVQPRANPYGASPAFADGRAMREPPAFAVAREDAVLADGGDVDFSLQTGRDDDGDLAAVPLPVTRELLLAGRRQYDVVCATCHGVVGDGQSVVAEKMQRRKPESLHSARVRALAPGRVFRIVGEGYGFMPGYAQVLSPEERWAVVAYLDALRLSRGALIAALAEVDRAALEGSAP